MTVKYSELSEVEQRWNLNELLKFDERDPCYTWLFPLALGEINPQAIWRGNRHVPRLVEHLTLYVHIPFCRFICKMCPFTHEPLGRKDLTAYVNALCDEINFYGNHPESAGRPVTTLYFGGGTASSLNSEQLEKILTTLRRWFTFTSDCQITLECHPRTVDRDYLLRARDLGINRVSFGIQSFQQKYIDSLKLHQRVEQSQQILRDALSVGFDTVAMDLMYRYAEQEVEELEIELDTALNIGVQGISTYALDADVRDLKQTAGLQRPISVEEEMYYYLHDRLHEEGFVQVAQPDYARLGHENRQLRDLWGAPQAENLSFGAGAFSESFNGVTWANVHDSSLYTELVSGGKVPILMGQVHTWDDAAARYPALGVRCLEFDTDNFLERFGTPFSELYRLELAFLSDKGWIAQSDDKLTITRKGKYFIDNVSKTFFNPRNRGKTQLWGIQLEHLKPRRVWDQQEMLKISESLN